ncbi:hypothetical protein EDC04DRAFT_2675998 [Pisolithus marmoratus]|nr:hypothetical protein EDC04DRAFT_2675998 [Pisolithus marmoratus]
MPSVPLPLPALDLLVVLSTGNCSKMGETRNIDSPATSQPQQDIHWTGILVQVIGTAKHKPPLTQYSPSPPKNCEIRNLSHTGMKGHHRMARDKVQSAG